MSDSTPSRAKVALLSPSGWGNLGDAAIIESLLHGVRTRLPGTRCVAFTMNAAGTARDHDVEAHTLLGFSPGTYTIVDGSTAPGTSTGQHTNLVREAIRVALTGARTVAHALRAPAAVRALGAMPIRAVRELQHLSRSRQVIEDAAFVIVAGGGQLDDFWGGPWGHPYVLLRWALLARMVRARFVVASVGTGTLSVPGRFLIQRALSLADYRSFRDIRSREMLGAPALTGSDPVVPDLAYAFPHEPTSARPRDVLTVGLSPMIYAHPERWPAADAERYRAHVRSFAVLATSLLTGGHDVVLFTTAGDGVAVEDVLEAAREQDPAASVRLKVAPTPSLSALFDVLAGIDLVVAARLHGVLLSHVAGRPVLAVSHDRKVADLMADVGQSRYCFEIDGFDPLTGLERLHELAGRREALSREILIAVGDRRRQVEAQYDALFGPRPTSLTSSTAGSRRDGRPA
jgi:polysaccharide pyruvyl transferase WcaK-like protein